MGGSGAAARRRPRCSIFPSDRGLAARPRRRATLRAVRVSAARAAAADWVLRHVAGEPGFVGAYFSGSTIYLPGDAEVPVGSDVDVMVVSEAEDASDTRSKFVHDGALIEISRLRW